jgi:hypothetical protein
MSTANPKNEKITVAHIIRAFSLSALFIFALILITHLLNHPVSILTWIFCWLVIFIYLALKSKLKSILKQVMLP